MIGEPGMVEYGRAISLANKNISTDGFICTHNNCGWLGYWIQTPHGRKYCLRKNITDKNYSLCKYLANGSTGEYLGLVFSGIEECKAYLKEKDL